MVPKRRTVLIDPGESGADRTRDAHACPLGRRSHPAIAAPEADRTGQLAHEKVAFLLGAHGPFGVAEGPRLVELALELLQPAAVRSFRLHVERLTHVRKRRRRELGLLRSHGGHRATLAGDEIERVELAAGLSEQARQVPQPLGILEPERVLLVRDRPVLAVTAKGGRSGHRGTGLPHRFSLSQRLHSLEKGG
jgi:hypothetical protein